MPTTLDLANDVPFAVKASARRQQRTAGEVRLALGRQALTGASASGRTVREPEAFHRFEPFAAEGRVVAHGQIDDIRDRDGV